MQPLKWRIIWRGKVKKNVMSLTVDDHLIPFHWSQLSHLWLLIVGHGEIFEPVPEKSFVFYYYFLFIFPAACRAWWRRSHQLLFHSFSFDWKTKMNGRSRLYPPPSPTFILLLLLPSFLTRGHVEVYFWLFSLNAVSPVVHCRFDLCQWIEEGIIHLSVDQRRCVASAAEGTWRQLLLKWTGSVARIF